MKRLLVVAAPHQLPIVEELIHRFSDTTVLWHPRRPPASVATATSLMQALDHGPETVLILTPSTRLKRDLEACRAAGTELIAAGPLPGETTPLRGAWLHDGQATRLIAARQRPAFGHCVYYRRVSGGGADGLMPTWWALWHAVEEGHRAVGDDFVSGRLNVTRAASRRGWHAALHLKAARGAAAQLIVTPQPDSEFIDRTLVGTGGTITTQASDIGAHLVDARGITPAKALRRTPLRDWVQEQLKEGVASAPRSDTREAVVPFTADQLLSAIRTAARQGETVRLD